MSGFDTGGRNRTPPRFLTGAVVKLAADEITAEHEEEIHADPAETVNAIWQREAEDPCVIEDHDEDRERAEKVETRFALATGEAWIDGAVAERQIDAREYRMATLRRVSGCAFCRARMPIAKL